jgi:hypothetical protein
MIISCSYNLFRIIYCIKIYSHYTIKQNANTTEEDVQLEFSKCYAMKYIQW